MPVPLALPFSLPIRAPLRRHLRVLEQAAVVRPREAEALAEERAVGEPFEAERALETVHERGGARVRLGWGGGSGVVLRGEDAAFPALHAPETEQRGEEDEPP